MKQISVIVPIFNAEKYLRECIDSILAQSYKDYQLILVDDGSSDCSGLMCDEYKAANGDVEIIVLHKDNGGVLSPK